MAHTNLTKTIPQVNFKMAYTHVELVSKAEFLIGYWDADFVIFSANDNRLNHHDRLLCY